MVLNKILELHVPEFGDWTVAYIDGECVYAGDDYARPLLRELCEHLNIEIKTLEYPQDEYEEKF